MNRVCPNCGRSMGEFDPVCGPGGLGCLYCTKKCPNCGREVFDQDIIYSDDGARCKYCRSNNENPDDFNADMGNGEATRLLNLSTNELIKEADRAIKEAKENMI